MGGLTGVGLPSERDTNDNRTLRCRMAAAATNRRQRHVRRPLSIWSRIDGPHAWRASSGFDAVLKDAVVPRGAFRAW